MTSELSKQCIKCGQTKLLGEFTFHKYRPDLGYKKSGIHKRICKACYAAQSAEWRSRPGQKAKTENLRLIKTYGLSFDQFNELFTVQGGRCAICDRHQTELPGKARMHIDHDHETGQIRGLLCFKCNSAVGNLDDDPARMLRAVKYLETHRSPTKVEGNGQS